MPLVLKRRVGSGETLHPYQVLSPGLIHHRRPFPRGPVQSCLKFPLSGASGNETPLQIDLARSSFVHQMRLSGLCASSARMKIIRLFNKDAFFMRVQVIQESYNQTSQQLEGHLRPHPSLLSSFLLSGPVPGGCLQKRPSKWNWLMDVGDTGFPLPAVDLFVQQLSAPSLSIHEKHPEVSAQKF